MGRRCIGLDVHREFAQVAVWEDGQVRHAGQVAITGEALRVFVDSLGPEDEVAIEATCNTHAMALGDSANAIAFPSGSGTFTWRTPFE